MIDDDVKVLLTNENFVRWVKSGDPSKNQYWVDWLAKNPEKKKAFKEAQELVRSMKYADTFQMKERDNEELYFALRRQFDNSLTRKPKTGRYWLSGIAASLLLLVGMAIYYVMQHQARQATLQEYQLVEKSAPYGTKLTLTLPDGSVAKLNSGSKLIFRTPFGQQTREVILEGEAFFEVTEDPSKPFIVNAREVKTTVLGTAFNMRAYEDDDQVNVALVSGMVKVNIDDSVQQIEKILNPLEMVTFSKKDKHIIIKKFDPDVITSWKDQVIYFQKESLPDVIDRLEKWYGVKIIIDNPKNRTWSYTGKFRQKSLDHVLLRMSFTEDFTYEIRNDMVSININ